MDENETFTSVREHLKKAEDILRERSPEAAVNYVKSCISAWKEEAVYCAIIGNSGVGKSTFINAIRGLKDDDPDAAPTGVIDTTKHKKDYCFSQNERIILSDLPGCGIPDNPVNETSFERMQLERYDAFLIISSTRFFDSDKRLTELLNKMEKPYFFVRTKIDQDISNNKLRKHIDASETKETIRKDLEKHLQAGTNEEKQKIYLISSFEPASHDFTLLVQDIIERLPEVKADAMIFSVQNFSCDIIDLKMKALYKRSYIVAMVSALCALPPITGLSLSVDLLLIASEFVHYRKQLDIAPVEEETSDYISKLQKEITQELSVSNPSKDSIVFAGSRVTKDIPKLLTKLCPPMLAQAISGGLSFIATLKVLHDKIERLGSASKTLIAQTSKEDLRNLMDKM